MNVCMDPRDDLAAHVAAMRAFAMSLTRHLPTADDLVHDTLVRAWAEFDRYAPGTSMRAWLFGMLRRQHFAQRAVTVSPDRPAPAEDFDTAFDRLSDEEREALVLIGAEGFSIAEAADLIGVSGAALRQRIDRARTRLGAAMGLDDTPSPALSAAMTAPPSNPSPTA